MPIPISEIGFSHWIIYSVLVLLFFLTLRKKESSDTLLSMRVTEGLKGVAILAVVFAHIGYVLVSDSSFLYPLSTVAGMGVDVFLLLSGYGLTMSMQKHRLSPFDFYAKRLMKVLIPFWIVLVLILVGDFVFLDREYPLREMIGALMLWFPRADVWQDINSPFWYMTWILFFYLLFPIFFSVKRPWFTAIILACIASIFAFFDPLHLDVTWLHRLHTLAFSIGIILAWLAHTKSHLIESIFKVSRFTQVLVGLTLTLAMIVVWGQDMQQMRVAYPVLDSWIPFEQMKSIGLTMIIVSLFVFQRWMSRFLCIFGVYSYEIYLIHWPLLARYDVFFYRFSPGIALLVWLIVLLIIAMILQMCIKKVLR